MNNPNRKKPLKKFASLINEFNLKFLKCVLKFLKGLFNFNKVLEKSIYSMHVQLYIVQCKLISYMRICVWVYLNYSCTVLYMDTAHIYYWCIFPVMTMTRTKLPVPAETVSGPSWNCIRFISILSQFIWKCLLVGGIFYYPYTFHGKAAYSTVQF